MKKSFTPTNSQSFKNRTFEQTGINEAMMEFSEVVEIE